MHALRTFAYTVLTIVILSFVAAVGVVQYDADTRRAFLPGSPLVETIYHDGGGDVFEYVKKYGRWADDGRTLRIDGVCASACTYFLKDYPSDLVCATERATFGVHGVYQTDVFSPAAVFKPDLTQYWHQRVYPDWFIKLLADRFGFDGKTDVEPGHAYNLLWLTRDDLRLQHCQQ